jgi:hypothetical protein
MSAAGSNGIAGIGWGGEFLSWIMYRYSAGRISEDILELLRRTVSQAT